MSRELLHVLLPKASYFPCLSFQNLQISSSLIHSLVVHQFYYFQGYLAMTTYLSVLSLPPGLPASRLIVNYFRERQDAEAP